MNDLLSFDEAILAAGTERHSRIMLSNMVNHFFGTGPKTSFFRLIDLPMSRVSHLASSLADYSMDGDDEGVDTVNSLIDAFTNGDDVPPIIFGRNVEAMEGETALEIMDGLHRLCAAKEAGLSSIMALEFVYPADR